jgi:hypothetical protein
MQKMRNYVNLCKPSSNGCANLRPELSWLLILGSKLLQFRQRRLHPWYQLRDIFQRACAN